MDYEKELKQIGLKNTKHRSEILRLLDVFDMPLSASSIYNNLKEKNVNINLSTVYRTLEILSEINLIKKLTFTCDNSTFYESNNKGHRHYLICLKCKKIIILNKCPIKGYQEVIEQETDYTVEGHKLDIYGYCPNCK